MKPNNHTADHNEDVVVITAQELFPDREFKNGNEAFFHFQSSATAEKSGHSHPLDTRLADNRVSFEQNLKYWNHQTAPLSVNNFDNTYFEGIVAMGTEAVPYIIEEMKKGPTPLVHALDLIFPGVVEYDGYVSLKDACDTWLSILQ